MTAVITVLSAKQRQEVDVALGDVAVLEHRYGFGDRISRACNHYVVVGDHRGLYSESTAVQSTRLTQLEKRFIVANRLLNRLPFLYFLQ